MPASDDVTLSPFCPACGGDLSDPDDGHRSGCPMSEAAVPPPDAALGAELDRSPLEQLDALTRDEDAAQARRHAAAAHAEQDAAALEAERSPDEFVAEEEPSLAERARHRMRSLLAALEQPSPAAELRDVAIAVHALAMTLEELERQEDRRYFHRVRLEAWARQLAELLELVGEPRSREHQRTFYDVREGLLYELLEELGQDEPAPARDGMLARLEDELERARGLARDAAVEARAVDDGRRRERAQRDVLLASRLRAVAGDVEGRREALDELRAIADELAPS